MTSSMFTLMRAWPDLPASALDDLVGELRAEFVKPMRHIAPAGLSLIGLPRWHGKRFTPDGAGLSGVNLLRPKSGSAFEERLPMRAATGSGISDGRPSVVITYAADSPRPWRWIRD